MIYTNANSVVAGNRSNFEQFRVPFSRAKGICPICGKPRRARDWKCSVTVDNSLAICSYVPSDRTDANGRYIHIIGENKSLSFSREEVKPKPNKIASAEKTDRVYTEFLSLLKLESHHADNLLERGLSDTAIANKLYASVPNKRNDVIRQLCEKLPDGELSGVAGFYTDKNDVWQMMFSGSGFFVPFRNTKGQIIGLQIRLDSPLGNSKYIWFSSSEMLNGTAQTMLMHFSSPDLVKEKGNLILTEGALKSDIFAEIEGCAVAAIAGTGISEAKADEYAQILVDELPVLKTVQLAPDADWINNSFVRKAFSRLEEAIKKTGIKTEFLSWDKTLGKGIDDVMKTIRRLK